MFYNIVVIFLYFKKNKPYQSLTMPKFPELPHQISDTPILVAEMDFSAFKSMVYEGAAQHLTEMTDAALDRLIEELKVTEDLDLKDYFIFWKSIVQFCEDSNICIGLGRGVINGSLIAYCLGFTKVNPLDWNLPYQRFIHPLTGQLPVFSIDIPVEKREIVLQFLKESFGRAHVGLLAGRNDDESGITNIAKVLSPAGSGIVISAQALKPTVPTLKLYDESQELIVDYPTKYLQNLGCFKFDIFGLKQLDFLQELKDQKVRDLYPAEWNDPEVFSYILSSKSKNIFPFQNDIMRPLMKELNTDSIEKLALAYSLSRPGLQSYIEDIKRIHKDEDILYFPHDSLFEPLSSTYGFIVYKEQFLEIVVAMSGFGYEFADMMYRFLLEDDPDKHTLRFIDACEERGIDMSIIQQVMAELIASHPFLFSKAHAIGTVMLGYTQVWHHIRGTV